MIACGPIRCDYVSSAPLHCHDCDLPSILAGRFNKGDSVFSKDDRATLIDDGGQSLGTEIEGEQKPITVLKVTGVNGQVYTDPLAWKLGKQGQWDRSERILQDHWRSIQHTDTRHPDDSKYRTLSLGTVKELRNATAHLLSERGGGDEKDTLRIKFTVGDSFAPGTVVVMTPGEVLADAQDEEFQVGIQ